MGLRSIRARSASMRGLSHYRRGNHVLNQRSIHMPQVRRGNIAQVRGITRGHFQGRLHRVLLVVPYQLPVQRVRYPILAER